MEYAFNEYNNNRLRSSINYLTPTEFEKHCDNREEFENKFMEGRKKKGN